jgi:hypothetical protein
MSKFFETSEDLVVNEFWAVMCDDRGPEAKRLYLTTPISLNGDWKFKNKLVHASHFSTKGMAEKAIEILGDSGPGEGYMPPEVVKVVVSVRTDYTVELI